MSLVFLSLVSRLYRTEQKREERGLLESLISVGLPFAQTLGDKRRQWGDVMLRPFPALSLPRLPFVRRPTAYVRPFMREIGNTQGRIVPKGYWTDGLFP